MTNLGIALSTFTAQNETLVGASSRDIRLRGEISVDAKDLKKC